MIPRNLVERWRPFAEWQMLSMVEQDLIISRALVCLYNDPMIADSLVFRGGTALNKLYIQPAARYSEDIDFVQKRCEPIGPTIDKIKAIFDPWLGKPKWKITQRGAKIIYKYTTVEETPAKLKIEINTTEHFQVLPLKRVPFSVQSEWFSGDCDIVTYALEELMATKLRALYQRRKGRDLFDLWLVVSQGLVNIKVMIDIFQQYCANGGVKITKSLFHENMDLKRLNRDFQVDMSVLLSPDTQWHFDEAFDYVQDKVIDSLPD